jgi:hypothetical protein
MKYFNEFNSSKMCRYLLVSAACSVFFLFTPQANAQLTTHGSPCYSITVVTPTYSCTDTGCGTNPSFPCNHCVTLRITNNSANCYMRDITVANTSGQSACFRACNASTPGSGGPTNSGCNTVSKRFTTAAPNGMPPGGFGDISICYNGTGPFCFEIYEDAGDPNAVPCCPGNPGAGTGAWYTYCF